MVTVLRNGYVDPSSNPVLGILHSTNTLKKAMNQPILPPPKSKLQGRVGSLTLVCKPV